MFTSSKNESSGLFNKAAGAYLTYKAMPFGSKKKEETGMMKKLFGGYVAMKVIPKMVKWIGGGALLAYAANYGYTKYNERRMISAREENF